MLEESRFLTSSWVIPAWRAAKTSPAFCIFIPAAPRPIAAPSWLTRKESSQPRLDSPWFYREDGAWRIEATTRRVVLTSRSSDVLGERAPAGGSSSGIPRLRTRPAARRSSRGCTRSGRCCRPAATVTAGDSAPFRCRPISAQHLPSQKQDPESGVELKHLDLVRTGCR